YGAARGPRSSPGNPMGPGGDMFRNLGHTLALLRDLRRLSQATVARRAGIGKGQLSKYESGKELPKLDSLEKVLTVLGVGAGGFFSLLAVVEDWVAALDREEKTAAASLPPPLPGTGFAEVDQAFKSTLCELLTLQRSVLEILMRGVGLNSREPS